MSSKYLRQASAFAAAGVLSLMTGMVWAEEKPSGHPSTPETEMRYKGAPVPLKPEEAKETVAPEAPGLSKTEFRARERPASR
jgi:nitrite reductase (NO-forming)/hydroxylamine reductase